ncbi:MAG: ABC transporter substrate-binding protein [Christensenellaceae bacterium]|jgi:peptide/nickel transport system substrate-binding protein
MKSVKKFFILYIVCSMFFLCACSSSLPVGSAEATEEATVAAEETEPPKIRGGELFIAMPVEAKSFDPLDAHTEDMTNLLSLIFESPLAYEADGRLVPELASSFEVDASKTVFTFHLKRGVYFGGGGAELKADDIIFSANRILESSGVTLPEDTEEGEEPAEEASQEPEETPEPETESADGDAEDEPAKLRYEQYSEYVQNIEAVDEYTVRLTMTEPGNKGLHFMTFPVMSRAYFSKEKPVGTGPYMVESIDETQLVLAANSLWGGDEPYIQRIVAKPIEDTEEKIDAVSTSLLDLITTDVRYTEKYKKTGATQIIDYMTNYYDCIVPNLSIGQLRDENVRQALSYAIDRRKVISTVLLNHAIPANMPIASDYYAYDSKYKLNDYDINRARELLAESGYRTEENGEGSLLSLNMIVPDNREANYRKEAARSIKKQLAEVGIEINLEIIGTEEYEERLTTGNFALAYCSFYMDIVPDLEFMFGETGEANYGNVSSHDIIDAIDKCALAVTEEETLSAYSGLQQVLTERVPQVGLFYRTNSIIYDYGIRDIGGVRQNMIFSKIEQWSIGYPSGVQDGADMNASEPKQEEATPAPAETGEGNTNTPPADSPEPQDTGEEITTFGNLPNVMDP